MKEKGLLLAFISILTVAGVTSCNNSNTNTFDYDVSTTKMLEQLKGINNYEMEIYNTKVGDKGSIVLNDKYYIDEINSYGYIVDSNAGVYKFDVASTGDIVGNEIISTQKSLDGLTYDFSTFDVTALDDEVDGVLSIKDKGNRQAFMKLIGEDTTNYQYISSLTASYDKTKKELNFNLTYNDTNSSYVNVTVKDFNNAKSSFVEDFIKNGGTYFTPTDEMKTVRNLFKNNNYSRYIYDTDNTTLIGKEYFTQQYWCTNYYTTTSVGYNVGYVTLVGKSYEGVTLPNGSYYFAPYADPEQEVVVMLAGTAFAETDMPTIMNYPGNLEALSYFNLYSYNSDYGFYFSDDYSIATDMYSNFGISNVGYTSVTLYGTGFNFEKENDNYKAKFYVVGSFDGTFGYLSFEFRDFGKTSHPGLEKFLAKLS